MLRIPTRGRCPNGYASQIFPSFFVSYWKGEVFAYVGLPQNLKDLKDHRCWSRTKGPQGRRGAYVCWPCACPVICARLLSSNLNTIRTEKITPHTSLNLNNPTDCALFLRHIFLASSHPLKDLLKQILGIRSVSHLASLTREQHPCSLHNNPAIMIDNCWWIPYISTPPSTDPAFVVPGNTPGRWVIWMYSVQTESHAPKTKRTPGPQVG